MKNLSQLTTTILAISLLCYFTYTGSKNTQPQIKTETINKTGGLFGIDTGDSLKFALSNNGELELIQNMIKAYNAKDMEKISSFFADTVIFHAMNGKKYNLTHSDFENSFNFTPFYLYY